MSDKTYEAKQKRIKRYKAIQKANIDDAFRDLCANPKGRDLLWWLLEISGVGQHPWVLDPYATSFRSGELNIGQQVLARLTEVNPEGYLTMMKENANARTALERDPDPSLFPDASPGNPGEYDAPGSNQPGDERGS